MRESVIPLNSHRAGGNMSHRHGGRVVFVTDQAVNPFVAFCDVQFAVESASTGFFNNGTSGFALIEAFIKGLSRQKKKMTDLNASIIYSRNLMSFNYPIDIHFH